MGILKHHVETLFLEAANKNLFKGHVLVLGQQAVYMTLNELEIIAKNHKKLNLSELPKDFDTKNKIPTWFGTKNDLNTNVQTIFKLLGANKVSICDISSYENPDFLIDLNDPIDEKLKNKFDVIFDCGTLEHIFNFPTAMWNLVSMLKTDGVLYLALPSSNAIDHGFYSYSPGLFYDYFNENGFTVLSCYLREGSPLFYGKKGKLFKYSHKINEIPLISNTGVEVIVIAQKNTNLSNPNNPIQSVYRNEVIAKSSQDTSRKKKFMNFVLNLLIFFQNFIPYSFERLIAKVRNKVGRNNLTFIKKL